jgi:hypothetical protein
MPDGSLIVRARTQSMQSACAFDEAPVLRALSGLLATFELSFQAESVVE